MHYGICSPEATLDKKKNPQTTRFIYITEDDIMLLWLRIFGINMLSSRPIVIYYFNPDVIFGGRYSFSFQFPLDICYTNAFLLFVQMV